MSRYEHPQPCGCVLVTDGVDLIADLRRCEHHEREWQDHLRTFADAIDAMTMERCYRPVPKADA